MQHNVQVHKTVENGVKLADSLSHAHISEKLNVTFEIVVTTTDTDLTTLMSYFSEVPQHKLLDWLAWSDARKQCLSLQPIDKAVLQNHNNQTPAFQIHAKVTQIMYLKNRRLPSTAHNTSL